MAKLLNILQVIFNFKESSAIFLCFTFLAHAKTDVPVFLLSGQSNMTGYGGISGLTTDQKKNVDNVKIYRDLVWEGDASND